MGMMGFKDTYVGYEAIRKAGALYLHYPIEYGKIKNFDDMERIWHHTFYNELRVAPEEHPVIMSEDIGNETSMRHKTTEIMFDTFDIPGFYLENSSVLALYSSGRSNGSVLNMGHTKTSCVAIHQGSTLPNGEISYFGGRDLDVYLEELIREETGISYTSRVEKEMIKDMKEKLCYVSMDPKNEGNVKRYYELPDGITFELDKSRYLTCEALFNPVLIDSSDCSIVDLIRNTILYKDSDVHKECWDNIVLTGGGSMFWGIADRISSELIKKNRVIAPPDR
jgi:actin, other eukaryote